MANKRIEEWGVCMCCVFVMSRLNGIVAACSSFDVTDAAQAGTQRM